MKESQIHQAFISWLNANKIPFVHARCDRKHTNVVGDPDFFCFLAGRVIGIEFKVGRNKLSAAQEKRIAYLRQAGNRVKIAYCCEQAILAVSEQFGVENVAGEPVQSGNGHPAVPSPNITDTKPALFILNFAGKDGVFTGDPSPGGSVTIVRTAEKKVSATEQLCPCGCGRVVREPLSDNVEAERQ